MKEENSTFFSSRLLTVLFPVYVLISISYLIWRVHIARHWNTWYAYPLIIAEAYSISITVLYLITAIKIEYPVWLPPLKHKKVDIFIPTYNEPLEVIKMTALGAVAVRGVNKVFILDDGNRKKVKILAGAIGAEYVARKDNTHAKAGNLNNGLNYSSADYLVCLDSDHVPQMNIIERMIGYFSDPEIAFIQSPQTFYNSDSVQFRKTTRKNLWNEQTMFYESIQPTKNSFNAAFFCGSGAMLRRSAVDSIGGFATGTVTEDIHTSIRLHSKGWKSYYINESLAYGIAPDDLNEYHKQRVRWGAGSIDLLFRSIDSPLRIRGLSLLQRICYFNSMVGPVNGLYKLFYLLLPAFILITLSHQNVGTTINTVMYLKVFVPYILFSYLISYVYSRGTFHPIHSEHFNIANILANVLALKGLFGLTKIFKVSNKSRGKKQQSTVYKLVLCFWAITVIADMIGINYWFFQSGNALSTIFNNLVGISLFWNTFNLLFLSTVIWYFNKHSEAHYSDHSIAANGNVYLNGETGYVLSRISLRGADIVSTKVVEGEDLTLTINSKLFGKLTLTGNIIESKRLKKGKYSTELLFEHLTLAQEQLITKYLFNEVVPLSHEQDLSIIRSVKYGTTI